LVADGQRLIVCLLPGLDGTGRLYKRLAAEMAADFDVRVIDYPVDGFDGYQALAEAVAPRLPQESAFLIVAESFAGPLAVLLAAAAPPGLRGVVIAASFLRNPVARVGLLSSLLSFLPAWLPPPLAVLEAVLMGGRKDVEVKRELEASLRLVEPKILKARLMAALRVDVRAEFKRLTVPVLYLRATRDRLLRSGLGNDFVVPEGLARCVDIEAPHFVFQVAAPQAAEAIRSFLRDRGIWNG
jgi:pimeloyl-ACP methyl ester carboxylesterase